MIHNNLTMIDGEAIGADITGTVIMDIHSMSSLTLQATIAGGSSPTGTCKVQVSNDAPPSPLTPFTPTNWFDLASATAAFTDNGTDGSAAISVSSYWARVFWDHTSGTGTLTAVVHAIGQR